jgi:cell fate regulator YaaT (PSP1 superfamily)
MFRRTTLRFALPVLLLATLLPAVARAQSQDTQSVAEAARRARAQKKNPEKSANVITDDTLNVKKGDVQSAAAEQLRIPGTPETPPAGSAASAPAQASKTASEEDAREALKERAALKEKIKEAQSDLDLLQREYQLEQDSFYSSPDYTKNTSGKQKLDGIKQQISDKQQEIEQLKAKLAALPAPQESSATEPPKS